MDENTRFSFGKNWLNYQQKIDTDRIAEAEADLKSVFGQDKLEGQLLDIGSGSGLFSRAALNLGAEVVAFDYDANAVSATRDLLSESPYDTWHVEQGDITNIEYVESLGDFDYVYCWGVAHHTGDMWTAVRNCCLPVRPGGEVCIGLYNRVPENERRWNTKRAKQLKRTYHRLPQILRPPFTATWAALTLAYRLKSHGELPWEVIRTYDEKRGMSYWHDQVDWCGGWPFEAATPQEVHTFVEEELEKFTMVRENIRSTKAPTAVNVYTIQHKRE
jgi:2-polyprenyl-6-hydroxyphenyl methylase/3-demethylubiquinone-9 3-methyltransferase